MNAVRSFPNLIVHFCIVPHAIADCFKLSQSFADRRKREPHRFSKVISARTSVALKDVQNLDVNLVDGHGVWKRSRKLGWVEKENKLHNGSQAAASKIKNLPSPVKHLFSMEPYER